MIYKDVQPIRVFFHHHEVPFQPMSSAHFASQNMDIHTYLFPGDSMYPTSTHQNTSGGSNASMPTPQFDYVNNLPYAPYFNPSYSTYPTAQIDATHEPWSSPPPINSLAMASAPSPISAMPKSPSMSSPAPIQSPDEPQIRMSSVYYDLGRNGHETIPLETGSLRK
jgi:hypothetical protein